MGDSIFKIPGTLKIKWAKEYLPHFRCTISIGDRIKIPTHVLLDTGCPWTPILPKDYLKTRLRVPNTADKSCWLANSKFFRVPVTDKVVYSFKTEDNQLVKITNDNTIYLVPMRNESEKINQIKAIPSIIGVDFLRDNGLSFTLDPSNDIIYIEGE